jgi:hypothetical protein
VKQKKLLKKKKMTKKDPRKFVLLLIVRKKERKRKNLKQNYNKRKNEFFIVFIKLESTNYLHVINSFTIFNKLIITMITLGTLQYNEENIDQIYNFMNRRIKTQVVIVIIILSDLWVSYISEDSKSIQKEIN